MVESNIGIKNSTPYIHTPIGIVERTIRTMEEYTKAFLIEGNAGNAKKGSQKSGESAEVRLEREHKENTLRVVFQQKAKDEKKTNIWDIENNGKDLLQNVYDSQGNHLTQIHYTDNICEKWLKRGRSLEEFGRTVGTEELQREFGKRKVSCDRFFVVKNRKQRDSIRNLKQSLDH